MDEFPSSGDAKSAGSFHPGESDTAHRYRDVMGTKRYRYVLKLRDEQCMSYQEMAELLKTTPLSCRLMVYKARKKFGIEVPTTNSRENRRNHDR